MPRLAIVISTGVERAELGPAAELAGAARAAGIEVELFFMSAGVRWLSEGADLIDHLADQGCDLVACASSLEAHGMEARDGVLAGSQDDHAAMVGRADRVVAFT